MSPRRTICCPVTNGPAGSCSTRLELEKLLYELGTRWDTGRLGRDPARDLLAPIRSEPLRELVRHALERSASSRLLLAVHDLSLLGPATTPGVARRSLAEGARFSASPPSSASNGLQLGPQGETSPHDPLPTKLRSQPQHGSIALEPLVSEGSCRTMFSGTSGGRRPGVLLGGPRSCAPGCAAAL